MLEPFDNSILLKRKEEEDRKRKEFEAKVKLREENIKKLTARTPEGAQERQKKYGTRALLPENQTSPRLTTNPVPGYATAYNPAHEIPKLISKVEESVAQQELEATTRQKVNVPYQELAPMSSYDKGERVEVVQDNFNKLYGRYNLLAEHDGNSLKLSTLDGKKSITIPSQYNSGVIVGQADVIKRFVQENSTQALVSQSSYREKAKMAKSQRPVAMRDGSDEATHKFAYASVGKKFVVYPTIFPNKGSQTTSNPEDWLQLDPDKAYSEAKRRGELIEFDDEVSAKSFAKGEWTKVIDPGEERNRKYFEKRGLPYDQIKEANRNLDRVNEEIKYYEQSSEEGAGGQARLKILYGKNWKDQLSKLKEERSRYYKMISTPEVRDAIEGSSSEQQGIVDAKRNNGISKIKESKGTLASTNKRVKALIGKDLIPDLSKPTEVDSEALQALYNTSPGNYQVIVGEYNSAIKTAITGASEINDAKFYLDAKLDKFAQAKYVGNLESYWNNTQSSYNEGDMKRIMAMSLTGNPFANPDDPEVARKLAELAGKNISDATSIDAKRVKAALETGNTEALWDAMTDSLPALAEGIANAVTGSIAQVLPIMLDIMPITVGAGAAGGAALGAASGPGSAFTAAGGAIQGLMFGQSMSQFALEMGDAMLNKAREKGYDLKDPEQAALALKDEDVINAAKTTGVARGGTIAFVDYATSLLTSKLALVKPLASRTSRVLGTIAAKTAIDIPSEMLGEGLAQLASGQTISETEIIMEGVGAFGMNSPTTAVQVYQQAKSSYYTDLAKRMAESPSFLTRTMGEDLGTLVNWTNNMQQSGSINAQTQQDILSNISAIREARILLSSTNANAATRLTELVLGTKTAAESRLVQLIRSRDRLSSNPTGNSAILSQIDNEINYTVQNREVAPKNIRVDLSGIINQDTWYMLNGRSVTVDELENFIGRGQDGDKDLDESEVIIVGDDKMRQKFFEKKMEGSKLNVDEYDDNEQITLSGETKESLPSRFRDDAKYNEEKKRWEVVTTKDKVKASPQRGETTGVVSDDVYNAFKEDKNSVPQDVLNGIAEAISQKKPLSERQADIYEEYQDKLPEVEDLSGVISSSKASMDQASAALEANDKQVYAIDRSTGDRFAIKNKEDLMRAGERGMKIITTSNKVSGALEFSKRGSRMAASDVRTLKYAKDIMEMLGLKKKDYQKAVERIAKAIESGSDVESAINLAIDDLNKTVGSGRWNSGLFSGMMGGITGSTVKKSAPNKDMRVDVNMGESMTKPRDVSYTKKVLNMLGKKFNADAKVINDPSIMKSGWVDYSGPKPTIYINTAYSAVDAPMHEYGHVFLDLIRENNLSLYQQILRETFGVGATDQKDFQTAYDNYIKSGKVSVPLFNYVDAKVQANRESGLVDVFDGMTPQEVEVYNAVKNGTTEFDRPEVVREMSIVERLYPEYNTRQRDEEVIVRLLGQYATKELDERAKSYNAIKEFWEAIKTMLAQAIKMSIKEIGVSVDENLIRDTIVPNSTLQYIGMLMANPNLKFTDKIQTQFASTQDPYFKKITDAYKDASDRARLMMLSPNAAVLAGQPNTKSWNMIVFEDRQKAINSMNNVLSGVKTVLSELESYMSDWNAVYRDLKDFVEKAGPLYDPYTQVQNNAFLDNDEFLRICKKVSDYIMDPSLERPSNIEMLIGMFGSDTQLSNDKLMSFLAAFEIERSLETGIPLQDKSFIKSLVLTGSRFENYCIAFQKDIESTNKDLTNQSPEFHLWSMVSSSKESSLGRAASFFGSTTGNFPTNAIDQKGVDNGRTRVMARQQNRLVKSANDGGDFLASSLVTNPMMRNLNESFLNGIAYVHIPFSGDIEGTGLIRDSKKENFGSVQTGGAQFNLSGLAPNNAPTMALGSQGEDFVGFLDANVDAQIKRMSATAAAPTGQRISKFTIDVPGRGPTEYKVEATRSKDGSVYVSFTAGGYYPMTGNAMQSMPMVASEVLRMWAGTPVTKITFSVAMSGGAKRPGGEVRAGVYNLIARRMFGKYSVESGNQYEIIVPDAFRPMVSLDNNAVKDMRVDGPGIVQNDAVNSTKYIIPMLKLLSKKFGTKYQVINDPSIMKNGWVDYNGAEPVIYVNMAYPTKDVAAHEYGHIFIDLLKVHNLTLYKDVVREVFGGDRKEVITDADYQQFRDTNKVSTSIFNGAQYLIAKGSSIDPRMQEMYDAVMNGTASTEKPLVDVERRYVAKNYPDLSIIEQEEEILVRLLGKLAADEFSKQSSLYETMMKFWRGIYDLIRSAIQLSVGDLAVPQSMGADVTLEFLAKALVNPRVVFTDRLKGFGPSTPKANVPQWLTDMEDAYNRARVSAASKMQSTNSVISVMGTSSDTKGQVIVFEDKNEAISVAEEYNSNMNKLFDIAVDYINNVTPEQMVRDYENAMIQYSGQHSNSQLSHSRSGFLESWYEDIQREIYSAFEGQGQMPDAFRIFALMVHPDHGGANISRFNAWDLVNEVAVGDSNMSIEKTEIEAKIDRTRGGLTGARDNFNYEHSSNPLHTASIIAATTTNSAVAYQRTLFEIRGRQLSTPDQSLAEETFKAPSNNNFNSFSEVPGNVVLLRSYIDKLASRMSFVAIPVAPAAGNIESPFRGPRTSIRTEPSRSYLATYILENEQGDWARDNSAALDTLVSETIQQARDLVASAAQSASSGRTRVKEIMVQVPEHKDKDTGVVTPAYVETYEVHTSLESNSFGPGISLRFNVKGSTYLKLENAQQSMPSVIRAAISLWEGTPLTYITFGVSGIGKDSYFPDGTIKRTAKQQREQVYNFFGRKVAGKYYEQSGSGTTILIPETMRPVINNTNQGIKDSRIDLDLREKGTGIDLNGTPDEEMAGQTLPPSLKEEGTKTPAIYPDEYRASDVLNENHAPNSAFFTKMIAWAKGVVEYVKKVKGVQEKRQFFMPFANEEVHKNLSKLRREAADKGTSDKRKAEIAEEMNRIAKEYYQETMLGMVENLLAVFDSLSEEFKAKAKDWYIGANRTANFLSKKYGVSLEQSSAILAVFSPKKEWFNNIADAERFLDVMKNDYQTVFTKDMADKVISKLTGGKVSSLKNWEEIENNKQVRKFAELLNAHFNKYGEVSMEEMDKMGVSEEIQSQVLRGLMTLNFPKNTYGMFNPDGSFDSFSTSTYSENSYENMGKAMRVYKDGSLQNISQELGGANKIRNFYNNIIDPYNDTPYVTADTHALAGALGISVSADDAEASGLFEEGFSPIYAMTKEAYIIAAQITGYSPREMQSIVWEAVRTGINDKGRNADQKQKIFDTATEAKGDKIGININDDDQPFTSQILAGEKTIETRKTPSLRPYVGKTIGIIKTGKKVKATLVGFAKIESEVFYGTKEEFDKDYSLHLVAPDSVHYGDGVKFGYKLTNIERVSPRPVKSSGIVSRKLDYKKSRYERTTETINENRSKNPEWGGGLIKIQISEFLQGVRDRAQSRASEILSQWKQLRGRIGTNAGVGGKSTSANYAFLNSRGSIKRSMQIVRMIQRAFPDAVVFMSESEWNEMAPSLNINANGAYGVTQNGKVYINPAVHKADTDMFETVIHEFGHLWLNYVKTYNKALYNKGIALANEMPEVISGEMSAEEMLATMIGRKGKSELLVASEKFGTKNKFKNWLGEFYDMLRNTYRFLRGMDDVEIASLTMDEFIGGALMDLFSGKPIPESAEAFEATFSAEPQFRETESVFEMVTRARLEGYKDSEIARMLEKNLPATPDRKDIIIDALRVQPFDLFNEFPDSFKNIPGGINIGRTMLMSIMDEVKKFAVTPVNGKKPTMAKVRQFALTELGKRDAFKDAPESLRTQMMMDLDSIINISENKAIQNRMKEYAKKVRAMKKGARELAKIKKETLALIRSGLPKTMYTRSEVVTLLRKLNEATYENIKQVQDEIFDFITGIKVKGLKAKIQDQLGTKTTKAENRRKKGVSSMDLQDTLSLMNEYFMEETASPQMIETKIQELNNILDSTTDPNVAIAASIAIKYNSALLLDDTDFLKFQYMTEVSDFLKDMINTGKAEYRQAMREQVDYYNRQKSIFYEDLTTSAEGGDSPGRQVDFGDQDQVSNEKSWLKGLTLGTQYEKFKKRIGRYINGLMSDWEGMDGLIDRMSRSAGEMFSGAMREIVVDRFNKAVRMNDIYNKFANDLRVNKAIAIWGEKYKKAFRKNAIKRYAIELENYPGAPFSMTMNQMYYIYNLYKDPLNHDALNEMPYFEGKLDSLMTQINAYLNTEDGQKVKEWADWQVDEFYPTLYELYSPVYERIYRTKMPWNRYYAGRIFRSASGSMPAPDLMSPTTTASFSAYLGGESTKLRKALKQAIFMDEDGGKDGDEVMESYVTDMNFFASHAEALRDTYKIFDDPLIKKAIQQLASDSVYKYMKSTLEAIQNVGFNYSPDGANEFIERLYQNIVKAKVKLVPRIALTQLTSAVGFIPYIGPVAWSKYLPQVLNPTTPSILKEILANSPSIAKRYTEDELSKMLMDYKSARNSMVGLGGSPTLNQITTIFIRLGDKGSLFGVLPNYLYYKDQYLKRNPGNEQGAINYACSKIEPQVREVAQSTAEKDRANAVRSGFFKYLRPFTSAPIALGRLELKAIRHIFRAVKGEAAKGTIVQNIGMFMVYHALIPALVTLAVKTPTLILGDWDEEDDDDLKMAVGFGNLFLLGLVPEAIYTAIQALVLEKEWAELGRGIIGEEVNNIIKLYRMLNATKPLSEYDKRAEREAGVYDEEFMKKFPDEEQRMEAITEIILMGIDMGTGVGARNAVRWGKNLQKMQNMPEEQWIAPLLNPPMSVYKGTGPFDIKRYTKNDLDLMRLENPEMYQRIMDENRGKK